MTGRGRASLVVTAAALLVGVAFVAVQEGGSQAAPSVLQGAPVALQGRPGSAPHGARAGSARASAPSSAQVATRPTRTRPSTPSSTVPTRTTAPTTTTATATATTTRTAGGSTTSTAATPTTSTTAVGTSGATGAGRIQYHRTYTGQGTFYGATGAGNCMYPAGSDRMIAAMNHADYENSQACGAYLDVTGPNGATITVRIVDQCPECQPGDLDLSQEAFAKLANPSAGRIPISWTLLSPELSGPVSYVYKSGSSQWWCAVQVRNHRNPVRSLEVKAGGSWKSLPRQDYNYFLSADGAGCGGDLRITDIYGNQLTDSGIGITPDAVQQGNGQFGGPR